MLAAGSIDLWGTGLWIALVIMVIGLIVAAFFWD